MTASKKNSERKTLPKNNDITNSNTDNYNNSDKLRNRPDNLSAETVKIIPVMEENFDLSKKTIVQETKIIKRLTTKTEKIEVPITYEEVYVNDKKLNIYEKEGGGLLSKLKDTVAHSITSDDSSIEYHYPRSSPDSRDLSSSSNVYTEKSGSQNQYHDDNYNMKGELVPLIEGQQKHKQVNSTAKMNLVYNYSIMENKSSYDWISAIKLQVLNFIYALYIYVK